jgi:hypothetical protein
MAARPKRSHWRTARRVFRWFRIAVWLLLLAVVIAAVWLNRVGVPDFLKERLVAQLRSRGVSLQFTRMRLHWYRGLIADNVRIGKPADTNAPQLSATEAELLVNGRALLQRKVQLTGLSLRGGRMVLPVWGTNDTPRELVVERITGELRFAPPDQWELDNLHAEAFGVKLLLAGAITNASAFQKIQFARKPLQERTAAAFWYDFIEKLERSEFESPAEIVGKVSGDANDPGSFRATVNVSSPRVNSPWGRGAKIEASVQLAPSKGGAFAADVKLKARDAQTRWGNAGLLNLEAHVAPSFTRWTPTNAHLSLAVAHARTPWANAATLTLFADFAPSSADETASLAHYVLRAQQVDSKWAKAARIELESDAVLTSSNLWPSTATSKLRFTGAEGASVRASAGSVDASLNLPTLDAMEFSNTNVTWWTRLDRVQAGLNVKASDVYSPRIEGKQLAFRAEWRAPSLALSDVHAALYDGEATGFATLNTETRRLNARARTTVDPHKVQSLFHTNTQHFLAQFTWERPPLLNAGAEVTLPVWTNGTKAFASVDWDREVLPTLAVRGDVTTGAATYRTVPFTSARSSFTFSNLTWSLPDLFVTRPEGRASIAHTGHSRTHAFTFDVDSSIDPKALAPLLTRNEREVLDSMTFTNMPHVRMQLAGTWREPEKISFRGELAATNLSFRGLPVREARSGLALTNQTLVFEHPVVVRSEGTGRADAVRIDIAKRLLFIENATGSLDPGAVTHAVGPDTEEVMKPYHFQQAPQGHVYGIIDLHGISRTDVHFEVAGGPFEWMNFRFQQITGHVHWRGDMLTLSNIQGSLHGGQLEAAARFDFAKQTKLSFRTAFTEINLESFTKDFGSKSNHVEGSLNGVIVITNGMAEDLKSWFGYGNLAVSEGLLWDFPIFGLFSPMLNAVKEGAGNSRAKEAVATFIVTNSVIYSSDLVIHASGMRLKGEGAVDFDTRVNGRMAAQLFRDTPAIGGLMATVLWPVTKVFEYKVTGTLARPQAAPLYIPGFLTKPLKTLKGLGGVEEKSEQRP